MSSFAFRSYHWENTPKSDHTVSIWCTVAANGAPLTKDRIARKSAQTARVLVTGFEPSYYFCVEKEDRRMPSDQRRAILTTLAKKLRSYQPEIVDRKFLYYYNKTSTPTLKVRTRSGRDIKSLRNITSVVHEDKEYSVCLFHDNIKPDYQLLVDANLHHSCWFEILPIYDVTCVFRPSWSRKLADVVNLDYESSARGYEATFQFVALPNETSEQTYDRLIALIGTSGQVASCEPVNCTRHSSSRLDYEYEVHYRQLHRIESELPLPVTLMSFDIETHTGTALKSDIPAFPSYFNDKDEVMMISVAFCSSMDIDEPAVWRRLVFLNAATRDKDRLQEIRAHYSDYAVKNSPIRTDDYDGNIQVEVIVDANEYKMISRFFKTMVAANPHFVLSYNGLRYDWEYLLKRYQRLNSRHQKLATLSVVSNNESIGFLERDDFGNAINLKMVSKQAQDSSSKVRLFYPNMSGRYDIDMYRVMRRDYKFPTYRLDYVARKLLNMTKVDLPYREMFQRYARFRLYSSGQSNDATYLTDFDKVVDYSYIDSELVVRLMAKCKYHLAIPEFANILNINPFEVYVGGTQAYHINGIYRLCVAQNKIFDSREKEYIPYEGGLNLRQEPGVYRNVMCVDLSALYPSLIRQYNISHDTLLHPDEWDEYTEEEATTYRLPVKMTFKTKKDAEPYFGDPRLTKNEKGNYTLQLDDLVCRFVNKQLETGVMVHMETDLVNSRKQVKRIRDQYSEDSIEYKVYDARQLALKISCNSAYGVLGLQGKHGQLSLVEGAAAITYLGRTTIMKANEWLANEYNGKLVYGDTDSSMISIPGVKGMAMLDKGKEVTAELNKQFPDLVNFEFEKAMDRMVIFSKKRYMSHMIVKDGAPANEILRRGIYSVRSDGCNWTRQIADKVTIFGLDFASPLQVIAYLRDEFERLMSGNVPIDDLIMCTTIKSYAPNSTATNATFARRMRQRGVPLKEGTKVHYVLCNEDETKVGNKMEEINYYLNTLRDESIVSADQNPITARETKIHIDMLAYIAKAMKIVDNLFPIAFKNDIERYHGGSYFEVQKGYAYSIAHLGTLLYKMYLHTPADKRVDTIDGILFVLEQNYAKEVQFTPLERIPKCNRVSQQKREMYVRMFDAQYVVHDDDGEEIIQ